MSIDFEGALEKSAAVALLGTIEAIKKSGVPSQKALRLGAFVLLEGALGREGWKLIGIPARTMRRYREEAREAAQSGLIPDDMPDNFKRAVFELLMKAETDGGGEENEGSESEEKLH